MSKYEGHTDGPWFIRHGDIIYDARDEPLALAFFTEHDAEANARLIADAPMLLKQRDILLAAMRESMLMIESILCKGHSFRYHDYDQFRKCTVCHCVEGEATEAEIVFSSLAQSIIQCEELEKNA